MKWSYPNVKHVTETTRFYLHPMKCSAQERRLSASSVYEPDSEPYQIASRIKEKLDVFIKKIRHAESLLEQADREGVEVSEPKFMLTEANSTLIFVRNLTHSFSVAEIEDKIGDGEKVVAEVIKAGEAALREAKFRKTGLIIATCFIFLLSIALFLKIRQIDKKKSS